MTTTVEIEMDNDTGSDGSRNRGGVRTKASDAYSAARERTSAAYSGVSDRAGRAAQRTSEQVDANPVIALVGGLALGAILGALLPKTRREEELIGDYGRKINDTAREAARAAKEAGTSKLDELGYNKDNIKQKVQSLRTDAAQIAAAAAQRVKGDAKEVASAAASDAKEVAGAAASEAKAAVKSGSTGTSGSTATTGGTGTVGVTATVEVTKTTGTTGGTGATGSGSTGGTGGSF